MRSTRIALRVVGAALVLGALGGWAANGTLGFGTVGSDLAPLPAVSEAPRAAPVPTPEPEPTPAPAPEPEPSPFTTTAPRGAIDTTTWPTAVRIPRLRVDAPVLTVGVGSEGALIVPHSPMDVGWYQGGSVPGEPGVALLTSHVDTRTEGRGVFAGLVRLEAGDTLTTVAADGTERSWRVTARTQHLKSELPPGLFARSGPPVLALVTCGGPFDREARSYRDNVIVWAEPSA